MSTSPRRSLPLRLLLVAVLALGVLVGVTVAPRTPATAAVPNVQAQVTAAWSAANARGERASVAVLDRVTGQFWGAGDFDSRYASASVVKVAIAVQLLVTGQMSGTVATQAYSMITRSDDDAATALYGRVGGDGVMPAVAARYGLGDFFGRPTAAGWWGLTQITAEGIVRLYDKIAADPVVAPWLLPAMAAMQCTAKDGWPQCTGLPAVAVGWRAKQGWMCCLDNLTRMHSTGYLNGDRYTVALLTEGSRAVYGAYGRDTLTRMAQALLPGGYVVDPHQPVGWLDRANAVGGKVGVGGWATDPDTPGTPLAVDVYVDGAFVTRTTANQDRPDVAAAGYPRQSGFLTAVTIGQDGPHTVCAYALNAGAGTVNPQLNCLSVTVSGAAIGYVDRVSGEPTRTLVRGWAADPDSPTTSLPVHVYVDGQFATQTTADLQRDDVNAATGLAGRHGFSVAVPTSPGQHTVCAYAFGTDGRVAGLSCLTGGYDGTPTGVVEQSRLSATWLRVAGWVRDPDASGAVPVDVWAAGRFLGRVTASTPRPDVDADLGQRGSLGFDGVVSVPVGASTAVVYAVNTGPGAGSPAIAAVAVSGTAEPVGWLDRLTATSTGFQARGWAADPDAGAGPVTVHLYLDGAYATSVTANVARTDVTAATGIPGNHGFLTELATPTGTHTVCAYAINVGPGAGNPSLGCLSTSR